MKRGLANLASVVTTAPLIGLFGAIIGILDSTRACIGQEWFCTQVVIEGNCEGLILAALGMLVAIAASWFYNYFSDRVELFSVEMQLASSELLNYLAIHHGAPAPPRR